MAERAESDKLDLVSLVQSGGVRVGSTVQLSEDCIGTVQWIGYLMRPDAPMSRVIVGVKVVSILHVQSWLELPFSQQNFSNLCFTVLICNILSFNFLNLWQHSKVKLHYRMRIFMEFNLANYLLTPYFAPKTICGFHSSEHILGVVIPSLVW